MVAGLKTVILLSFVLAVGFLLIILSCALWANWLPLLVALTFVLAPLPNALFAHCGGDEFSSNQGACVMSIIGGGLVYGTILAYSAVFRQEDEYD
ncbi:vacuolar protein sorting 55 protein [Suillus lakei]|nr:vacuolar protein sorting 55 protein [Suillus lakei]